MNICRHIHGVFIAFSLLLSTQCPAAASDDFIPVVRKFLPGDYHSANQNWALTQSADGWIYIANSGSMLAFDGAVWEKAEIPGVRTVRSVKAVGDRIYAGALEDFGWFERTVDGYRWNSLASYPGVEMKPNDEIWNIVEYGGCVIFHSFNAIFVYDGTFVRTVRLLQNATSVSVCADGLYLNFQFDGLRRMRDDFSGFDGCGLDKSDVVSVLDGPDSLLTVVTKSDGIYVRTDGGFVRFRTDADRMMARAEVNRAISVGDSAMLLGTISGGAFLIDASGHLVRHLSTDEGTLQNNTVLGLFSDADGNLWLALDNGLAMFDPDSGMSKLTFGGESLGTIYSVAPLAGASLLMATNQGLYDVSPTAGGYSVSKRRGGQFWDIYEGGGLTLTDGVCYATGTIGGREVLLQGSYSNISAYTRDGGGKWRLHGEVKGFSNPVRYMEIDHHGRVWCSHFHRGVYCLELDDRLDSVTSVRKFNSPSGATVNVFKVNNDVIFLDRSRVSVFDGRKLVPCDTLNNVLGNFSKAYRVARCGRDRWWFITQTGAALVRVNNTVTELIDFIGYSAFDENYIDDQQNIVSLNDSTSLLCFENSIGRYVRRSSRRDEHGFYPVHIRSVENLNVNSKRFRWSCPHFNGSGGIRFLCLLDGRPETSDGAGELSFSGMRPGRHRFTVQAVDFTGKVLSSDSFDFHIDPPAALSLWAICLYLLTLTFVVWGVSAVVTKIKVRDREHRLLSLEKEKLEQEVSHKSKELADSTMSTIRKNEILTSLRSEICVQKEALGTHYPDKYFNRVIRMIDDNISSDSDWEIFRTNFDRIHENFFRNLIERYPSLTQSDLRLCAFLRLNMSTKDIANLLNISLKGVEAARYRLRKKLSLESDVSLGEFLIGFR